MADGPRQLLSPAKSVGNTVSDTISPRRVKHAMVDCLPSSVATTRRGKKDPVGHTWQGLSRTNSKKACPARTSTIGEMLGSVRPTVRTAWQRAMLSLRDDRRCHEA